MDNKNINIEITDDELIIILKALIKVKVVNGLDDKETKELVSKLIEQSSANISEIYYK